jgi:ubiquinone/menaquinone biosynthesis C-methylase UbiE
MKRELKKLLYRFWYWYLSTIDQKGDILFMNWGYDNEDEEIPLTASDEPNRYPIQLYHRMTQSVDLKGKHIMEIGCGRGGGLDYIARTFQPATALGIDLEQRATDFGNKHFKVEGLSFKQGDAQNLPFDDNAFDIVLNVESSHRYPEMQKFLTHVERILKPNGYFLFTDFRNTRQIPELLEMIKLFDFEWIDKKRINNEVLSGLAKDSERRRQLVKKYVPGFLHKTALNFAGVSNSSIYKMIESGEYEYFIFILRKKNGDLVVS